MAGRSLARFIAPLALVVFALALFLVVSGSSRDDEESTRAKGAGQPAQTSSTPAGEKQRPRKQPRSYTVKAGDTPSGIAEKVDVPLTTLLELNPELDPQALAPGTKLKLR